MGISLVKVNSKFYLENSLINDSFNWLIRMDV